MKRQAKMMTSVDSCQRPLILALMLVTLWSTTNALGQTMQLFPIRSAPLGSPPGTIGDPVTPVFNSGLGCWEVQVTVGVEVDLDVQTFGWGNAAGSPTLAAVCGTMLSSGYDNGVGGILNPKGWPGSPLEGAYQSTRSCTGNGGPCVGLFDTTCDGGINGTCGANPNWVMPPCTNFLNFFTHTTLNYKWCVAAQVDCNVDDGGVKTLGGLIVDVPLDALGTYVIDFDPDPNDSFFTSGQGNPIFGLTFTPACITIVGADEPGRCCSDIGPNVVCEDVTPQVCSTRPEPRLFTPAETCDGVCGCPTCLSDADCNDGNACTADACDECGQCVHTSSCPEVRFYPIRSAPLGSPPGTIGNPVTPEFNDGLGCWELQVRPGAEVDLDIQAFGWGNAAGSPTLAALCGTVLSVGYNNNNGGVLNPKGWPGSPLEGAYQSTRSCTGNGGPCVGLFDTTCDGGINGTCGANPDWVMPPCTNFLNFFTHTTLNYKWCVAAQVDCNVDDGEIRTFGGLILDVPLDALGTYVIDFDPDPNDTFFTSGQGNPIFGLQHTPACITIVGADELGRCCSNIGPNVVCEDVTPQVCSTRPEPRSFTPAETCDGVCGCPTCLSDADCEDNIACTADACDECGQCVHTSSCPEMRFFPTRSAPLGSPPGTIGNPVTSEFNDGLGCWELEVAPGVEVDLDVQAFNWGNAAGSPTLGALCGTVLSTGYDNGVGGILNPKGWPGSPLEGAYQPTQSCTGNGGPCAGPFDPTCDGGINGTCGVNPNWVMPPCTDSLTALTHPTLSYKWCVAAQVDCNVDDGGVKTLGGLIVDVPFDALGTYVIDFDPDPNDSFFTSGQGNVIEGLTFTPACITVTRQTKNRYLTFVPGESGPVAYKLDMVSSLFHPTATVSGWIGVPDANGIASLESNPVTREWTEPAVHVTGCEITPVAEFELRASSDGGATFLPAISLQTTPRPGGKFWGDIVGPFDGYSWSPANGVTNIDDGLAIIHNWRGKAGAPELSRADVEPQEPNRVVNINDVLFVIFAFQGNPYPFGCPDDPCQDNLVNPCP